MHNTRRGDIIVFWGEFYRYEMIDTIKTELIFIVFIQINIYVEFSVLTVGVR